MPVDYSYPNARIRAMKSFLFDRSFYEKLMDLQDTSALITTLRETPYNKDVEEGTLKYPGALGVEEAFRKNIAATFKKILNMVEEETQNLVEVFLGRFDVHSLKTILRGKHVGASTEEIIDSLIPAGDLDEVVLTEAAKQIDLKAVIDYLAMLKVSYAKPLTKAFPTYTKTGNLAQLELALDKFYYAHSLERAKGRSLEAGLVKEILRREIDIVNIMTLLKLTRGEVKSEEAQDYFIAGGKEIGLEVFLSLVEKGEAEEVVQQLEKTPYGEALKKVLESYFKSGAISVLERGLEKLVIERTVKLFRADPLSIALIVAYIFAKFNEIVNLRIIVRGKALGMPAGRMREELVLV